MATRETWWRAAPRRIPHCDYRMPASYMVSFCTHRRRPSLSQIVGARNELSPVGKIVREVWTELPERFAGVRLDLCVLMPDHVHAILQILNSVLRMPVSDRPALPRIVGAWKSISALRIAQRFGLDSSRIWQKSFIDRILRNDAELAAARSYISLNPQRWHERRERER